MAFIAGATVVRDASGDIGEYLNGTFMDCTNRQCQYGLQNSFQVCYISKRQSYVNKIHKFKSK